MASLLARRSSCFLCVRRPSAFVCLLISSWVDTSRIGLGSTLKDSFLLNCSFKALSPNIVTFTVPG